MIIIGLLAGIVPANVAGEMTSIGTLFAFSLVCLGVIVVRRTQPNAPRGFKRPCAMDTRSRFSVLRWHDALSSGRNMDTSCHVDAHRH